MWEMQNYAKFESRVAQDSMATSPTMQMNDEIWINYWWSYSNSISDTLWNLFDWALAVIWILLVVSAIWYFFYIIISMIWKWAKETLLDIQNHVKFIFWNFFQCLNFIWTKVKDLCIYLRNNKKIWFWLIITLILLNFASNVINQNSKLLRIEKIQNGFVWVDLRNEEIVNPWYHAYLPYFSEFFLSRTSVFDFEIAAVTANTKEDMFVELDYRVWFKLDKEKLIEFYKKFGAKSSESIASDVVMPRVLEVLKWIIKQYSFKEISSKHNDIKLKTIEETNKVLEPIWITMDDINVLDIRLPENYTKSIEDLEKTENNLKLAEAQLEIQKKESEKMVLKAENDKKVKIIEAEWTSEYNKIVNWNPVSTNTLELKRIELKQKEIENKTEVEKLKIEKRNGVLPNTDKNFVQPVQLDQQAENIQ